MQIETLRDLYHSWDHTQPHLMKGPLQLVIHVVQNQRFGEQPTHWDKTNKELTSFKMVIPLFVFSHCISCSPASPFCTTRTTGCRDLLLNILPRWKIDGRNSASLNKHFPSLSIGVPVTVYHSLYTDKSFHVLNLGLRLLSQELPQAAGGDLTQRRYRKASSWTRLNVGCTKSLLWDWRRSSHGLTICTSRVYLLMKHTSNQCSLPGFEMPI